MRTTWTLLLGAAAIAILFAPAAPRAGAEEKVKRNVKRGKEEKPPAPATAAEVEAGEAESVVHVGNLIYARVKSSVCFSDHFLRAAAEQSTVSTSRRFQAVKLESKDVFRYPLVIMTGEGGFTLPEEERANLAEYLKRGGFLLASAGCSSKDWDRAFRSEIAKVLPDRPLKALSMQHPVFHTVKDIGSLVVKTGTPKPLEGIEIDGRLAVVYSSDGLNDTAHVSGCCCCGGNEIRNAVEINVNVLAYALTH
jgi:hypothetical protein